MDGAFLPLSLCEHLGVVLGIRVDVHVPVSQFFFTFVNTVNYNV